MGTQARRSKGGSMHDSDGITQRPSVLSGEALAQALMGTAGGGRDVAARARMCDVGGICRVSMKLVLATGLWARMTGLLANKRCREGEVLLLAPCKSIHSFGMRDRLDIAFLDAEAGILHSEREVPPARIRSHPKAVAVLERRSLPQASWPQTGEKMHLATAAGPADEIRCNQR